MKKMFVISILFINSLAPVFAGKAYVAPSLYYSSTRAINSRYEAIEPILTLGYGHIVYGDYLRFAGEVFVNPKAITVNNRRRDGISLRTDHSIGISLLPGYQLDDHWLGYGRVGLISTRFASLGTTRTGYQLGVGLQTRLSRVWSLRGEYHYAWYRSFSSVGTIKTGQGGISAVYEFC